MSDPVTNAEVEDVLSSIRRLVSEDKRPLQASRSAPVNDRLVLTPALRVGDQTEDEPAEDEVPARSEKHTVNFSDDIAAAIRARADADAKATDEARLDDPAHDYKTDPYNFEDDDDDDGDGDETWTETALARAEDDATGQQAEQHDVPEDEPPSKTSALSAKIEAMETAIGNISDTWEPDGEVGDDYSGTEAPAMEWEDDPSVRARSDHGVEEEWVEAHEDDEPAYDEDEMYDADDAAIAEPSKPAPEDKEPHKASSDDAHSERDDAVGEVFAFAGDDQLLDEEALRDLVAEIVRAELQGALGERITRNVRKLVRREIHRALTAQELE